MKIGIEVELNSYDCDVYYIRNEEGLDFSIFREQAKHGVGVKLSEEFYSTTIEYNFVPFEVSENGFDRVKGYLNEQIEKYNLGLFGDMPAIVGTHIHIFDDEFIRKNRSKLLKQVLGFLVENIKLIEDGGLIRILRAHQLWGYWSHNNGDEWYRFLEGTGRRPGVYDICSSKPKYSPIIRSPETLSGKPASLEIRIIPNEFMFNGKAFELMNKIEDGSIRDYTCEPKDFFKAVYDELISRGVYSKMKETSYGSMPSFLSEDDISELAKFYVSEHATMPSPKDERSVRENIGNILNVYESERECPPEIPLAYAMVRYPVYWVRDISQFFNENRQYFHRGMVTDGNDIYNYLGELVGSNRRAGINNPYYIRTENIEEPFIL